MITAVSRHFLARGQRAFADLEGCLAMIGTAVLVAALLMVSSGAALAHSFTAALLVVGEDREASIAEAVRGFLLAADERDGHANETSDGHLGGVDVHILPLPKDAAGLVEGLIGTPAEPADVFVVLGSGPAASSAARAYDSIGAVLVQEVLPTGWESDARMAEFMTRYRLDYGAAPGVMAATAYLAARRLDVAIRPLDGVSPRAALEEAWRATASDLPW
jgi:hypothetical protein